jgi:hypothetical protein
MRNKKSLSFEASGRKSRASDAQNKSIRGYRETKAETINQNSVKPIRVAVAENHFASHWTEVLHRERQ